MSLSVREAGTRCGEICLCRPARTAALNLRPRTCLRAALKVFGLHRPRRRANDSKYGEDRVSSLSNGRVFYGVMELRAVAGPGRSDGGYFILAVLDRCLPVLFL